MKHETLRRFAVMLILAGFMAGVVAGARILWEVVRSLDPQIAHLAIFAAAAFFLGIAILIVFPGEHAPSHVDRTVIRPGRSLD